MSDIQLDLDVLRSARSRVGDALATFESAGTVGGDVAPLTGEYRLERKVRDFADNWDYNRGKLIEKLEFLRGTSQRARATFCARRPSTPRSTSSIRSRTISAACVRRSRTPTHRRTMPAAC